MDIIPLLLSKKHEDSLSEEKRQRAICEFICHGVRCNLGFFTQKILYRGNYYEYVRCYDCKDSPFSLLSGMAGVAYYKPHLYLLLVWNTDCLSEAGRLQREVIGRRTTKKKDYNLRVVVFNWNDVDIDFDSYGITGGNIITSAQCTRSVSRDVTLAAWIEYEGRDLSPR